MRKLFPVSLFLLMSLGVTKDAFTILQTQTPAAPTHANILRGEYGRYRANNDLLYYHLDVRVDPDKKFLKGKTTIRIRMLKED